MSFFSLPSSKSSQQPVEASFDQHTPVTLSPESSPKTSPVGSAEGSETESQLLQSAPSTRPVSLTPLSLSDPEEMDEKDAELMVAKFFRVGATLFATGSTRLRAWPDSSAGGSLITRTASSGDPSPGIVGDNKKKGFFKELRHTCSVAIDAAKSTIATGKGVWESLKSDPMLLLGVDKLCVALAPEVPTLRMLPEEVVRCESPVQSHAIVPPSFSPIIQEKELPPIPIDADVSEPIRPFVAASRWKRMTAPVSSVFVKRGSAKAKSVTAPAPIPSTENVRRRDRSPTMVIECTALQNTGGNGAEDISGSDRECASPVEMFKPHRAECMVAIRGVSYVLAVVWFVGFNLIRHMLCDGSTWKGAVIPLVLFGAFSHIWLAVIIPCYAHRHPQGIQAGNEPRKLKTTIVFLITLSYGFVLLALNKDALHGYFNMEPTRVRFEVRHGRISSSRPGWAKAIILAHWLLRIQAVLTGWYIFGQVLQRGVRSVATGPDAGLGWSGDPVGRELALDVLLIGVVLFLEIFITRKLTVWGLHLLYTSKQKQDSKLFAEEAAIGRHRDEGPEDAGPSRIRPNG